MHSGFDAEHIEQTQKRSCGILGFCPSLCLNCKRFDSRCWATEPSVRPAAMRLVMPRRRLRAAFPAAASAPIDLGVLSSRAGEGLRPENLTTIIGVARVAFFAGSFRLNDIMGLIFVRLQGYIPYDFYNFFFLRRLLFKGLAKRTIRVVTCAYRHFESLFFSSVIAFQSNLSCQDLNGSFLEMFMLEARYIKGKSFTGKQRLHKKAKGKRQRQKAKIMIAFD